MKKSLVALATLAAATGAMAQVTISGYFGGSYDAVSITNKNAARTGNSSENRISDHSSRVVFNATEDLGGGLSAIGQFDLRFKLDATARIQAESVTTGGTAGSSGLTNPTVDPVSGGANWVGLASKTMGTLRLGRGDFYYIDTPAYMPAGMHTSANMSPVYHSLVTANTSRLPNSVWWVSPRMSGVEATLVYSTQPLRVSGTNEVESDMGTTTASRKGSGTIVRLNYTQGPLDATVAFADLKSDYSAASGTTVVGTGAGGAAINANADQKGNNVVVKYTIAPNLKLGIGMTDGKQINAATNAETKAKATALGAMYTVGAMDYALSYAKKGNNTVAGVEAANTGTSLVAVAATYNLSKRTAVSALWGHVKAQSGTTVTPFYQVNNVFGGQNAMLAGEGTRTVSLGMRHSF